MLHFLCYLKLRRDILNHAYLKRVHYCGICLVGVVVGAGFATGQEIFQFFMSRGVWHSGNIVTGPLITFRWNDRHAYRSSI